MRGSQSSLAMAVTHEGARQMASGQPWWPLLHNKPPHGWAPLSSSIPLSVAFDDKVNAWGWCGRGRVLYQNWSALTWAGSKGSFQEVVLQRGDNQVGGGKWDVGSSHNSRVRALLWLRVGWSLQSNLWPCPVPRWWEVNLRDPSWGSSGCSWLQSVRHAKVMALIHQ